jgi:Raf kinase inhibitor-like YbhB/YbcL family protein
MKITSPAFDHNKSIPSKYTCDGEDINPSLNFVDIPAEAKSLALLMDDPDAPAGMWDHWIVFNMPPTIPRFLKEKSRSVSMALVRARKQVMVAHVHQIVNTGISSSCLR